MRGRWLGPRGEEEGLGGLELDGRGGELGGERALTLGGGCELCAQLLDLGRGGECLQPCIFLLEFGDPTADYQPKLW